MKNFICYLHGKKWVIQSIPYLTIFWTLLILYLTLMPAESLATPSTLFSFSKIGHFGMFGGWTGLVGLYLFWYKGHKNPAFFYIVIAGIIFGALIEYFQFIMPFNRTGSWIDIIYNSLGCITAYFVLSYIKTSTVNYADSEISHTEIPSTIHQQQKPLD